MRMRVRSIDTDKFRGMHVPVTYNGENVGFARVYENGVQFICEDDRIYRLIHPKNISFEIGVDKNEEV